MPYVLALIIIIYSLFFLIFNKNPQFLKWRKWVDIAAIAAILLLILFWAEHFDYTFLLILYFFVSIGFIGYLYLRLKKAEVKKERAQETIKVLKDEESVLEEKLQEITDEKNQNPKQIQN